MFLHETPDSREGRRCNAKLHCACRIEVLLVATEAIAPNDTSLVFARREKHLKPVGFRAFKHFRKLDDETLKRTRQDIGRRRRRRRSGRGRGSVVSTSAVLPHGRYHRRAYRVSSPNASHSSHSVCLSLSLSLPPFHRRLEEQVAVKL